MMAQLLARNTVIHTSQFFFVDHFTAPISLDFCQIIYIDLIPNDNGKCYRWGWQGLQEHDDNEIEDSECIKEKGNRLDCGNLTD